jgi:AraC-like DNA-binding protein
MTETSISPVKVSFKHDPPGDLQHHEQAFQCPVHFNDDSYSIVYATKDLEMRTAKADASINQFLVERVKEETQGIEISPQRISDEVEELIKNALPSGIPGVQQISEHMGMSKRTLTRRLAEHQVSFRDLIQKTQERQARQLLKNPARSIADIAFETGFSEQSAFNRAFKRWTGQSPLEFRKSG